MKDYVNQPMITYIGNKRKLVDDIENVVKKLNPKTPSAFGLALSF